MPRTVKQTILTLLMLCALPAAAAHAQASPGNMFQYCQFDHDAWDDPINHPGQPGGSHEHNFAGAKGINAFSTVESMKAADTTCALPGATVGYWMPGIIATDGITHVHFTRVGAYYRRADRPSISQLPDGLKHIQGNPENKNPQTYSMTYSCSNTAFKPTIPTSCPAGQGVQASIYLPKCWDGVNTDTPTHKTLGACGSLFPVQVMQIQLTFEFPATAVGGRLSSDLPGAPAGTSGHADYWNTWDPATIKKVTDLCLNADRHCRVDSLNHRMVDVGVSPPQTVFVF